MVLKCINCSVLRDTRQKLLGGSSLMALVLTVVKFGSRYRCHCAILFWLFEIFQNKKVKRFYSPLNWMSLKTRKGVDLGVKLPWFTSWLFQLINLVVLLLVPEFLAPVDQEWPLGSSYLTGEESVGALHTDPGASEVCRRNKLSDSSLLF